MEKDKTLGPNGFHIELFHESWETTKQDLLAAIGVEQIRTYSESYESKHSHSQSQEG